MLSPVEISAPGPRGAVVDRLIHNYSILPLILFVNTFCKNICYLGTDLAIMFITH